MAFDAFIKIDGITGEAEDHKHKGSIEVFSYNFGVLQRGSSSSGTGAGAGKAEVNNLVFTKRVDKSSPVLFMKCATGEHIKSALLTVRKAGGSQLEFVKVTIDDVVISEFKSGSENKSDEVPMETVELQFTQIKFEYQAQDAKGAASGGPVSGSWNVKTNKSV
ncbi:MAG: Hcp family type VI secretion system effector [Phycisphaerales bacterium]